MIGVLGVMPLKAQWSAWPCDNVEGAGICLGRLCINCCIGVHVC